MQKIGSTLSYKVAASNSTGKKPVFSGITDPTVNNNNISNNNSNSNHNNFLIR